jgi:hypothetical protein
MEYLAVFILVFAILALCFHPHPQINAKLDNLDTKFFLICMGYAYLILICTPPSVVAFQSHRKKASIAAEIAILVFFVIIKILSAYKLIRLH